MRGLDRRGVFAMLAGSAGEQGSPSNSEGAVHLSEKQRLADILHAAQLHSWRWSCGALIPLVSPHPSADAELHTG